MVGRAKLCGNATTFNLIVFVDLFDPCIGSRVFLNLHLVAKSKSTASFLSSYNENCYTYYCGLANVHGVMDPGQVSAMCKYKSYSCIPPWLADTALLRASYPSSVSTILLHLLC